MIVWHQLNVALTRLTRGADATPAARAVFARLDPIIEKDRQDGTLRRFFFMRKAPDMRLRFGLTADATRSVAGYVAALEPLIRAGRVERAFASVYEPEARLFGGEEAMAHVHAHFDADTRLFLRLDRLSARREATLPLDVVARAVLDDLFERTLDGPSEVWDAWANVAEAVGGTPAGPREAHDLELGAVLRRSITEEERAVLEAYREANAALAAGLSATWSAGRLTAGLRATLPFIALFHFNRYGLDASLRSEIARAQVASRDPRRGMKGVLS